MDIFYNLIKNCKEAILSDYNENYLKIIKINDKFKFIIYYKCNKIEEKDILYENLYNNLNEIYNKYTYAYIDNIPYNILKKSNDIF